MNKKIVLEIILPVHYEQDNIREEILLIERSVKTPHKIIAVYQDSNDPSKKIMRDLQKKIKNLRLIKSTYGIGMIEALRTGFDEAKAKIICVMMSDLSDNPGDIDKMVKKINDGYDLVCASRYGSSGKREGGPKIKGLLSFIACKTLRILTGIPTNDATNAFKCFRKELLMIPIESKSGFEFPLELSVKAYFSGYRITEIPTIWHERKKGSSKFRLGTVLPTYLKWYMYAVIQKIKI